MKWNEKLFESIIENLPDLEWKKKLTNALESYNIGIHLAIFKEPFFSLIIDNIKTIESRLSLNRISPYNKINKGDIVLMQDSLGNIAGIFIAGETRYFENLNSSKIENIYDIYGSQLCIEMDRFFFECKQNAKFCSLIYVNQVIKIKPIKSKKKSRLGWIIIKKGITQSIFN